MGIAEAKIVLNATDNTSGPLSAFQARIAALTAPLDGLRNKLLGAFPTSALERLQGGLNGFGGKLAAIGIGGGVAVGGLIAAKGAIDAVIDTAKSGAELFDLKNKFQLTSEEVQVFAKVAKETGSPLEELAAASRKLKENLGNAQIKGGESLDKLTRSLEVFGITAGDVKNMSSIDLMQKIGTASRDATGISNVDGASADQIAALKVSAAKDLFGKIGVGAIPGIERLADFRKISQGITKSGLSFTNEQMAQAKRSDVAYERSKGTLSGLKRMFGIEMLPVFEQVSNVLDMRMKANRTAMMPGVKALAEVLSTSIGPFLDDMDKAANKTSGVFKVISKVADLVGWDKLVFGGLALIAAPFVASAGAIAVALGGIAFKAGAAILSMGATAVGPAVAGLKGIAFALQIVGLSGARAWLLALGPLVLIGATIAGVAYLIYDNWGGIKTFFSGVFDGIVSSAKPLKPVFDAIGGAAEWVGKQFSSLMKWFSGLFGETDKSKEKLQDWSKAGQLVGEVIGSVILAPINKLISIFKALSDGFDFAKKKAGQLFDFLGALKMPEFTLPKFEFPAFELPSFKQIFDAAIAPALGPINDAFEFVKVNANKLFDFFTGFKLPSFDFPKFDFPTLDLPDFKSIFSAATAPAFALFSDGFDFAKAKVMQFFEFVGGFKLPSFDLPKFELPSFETMISAAAGVFDGVKQKGVELFDFLGSFKPPKFDLPAFDFPAFKLPDFAQLFSAGIAPAMDVLRTAFDWVTAAFTPLTSTASAALDVVKSGFALLSGVVGISAQALANLGQTGGLVGGLVSAAIAVALAPFRAMIALIDAAVAGFKALGGLISAFPALPALPSLPSFLTGSAAPTSAAPIGLPTQPVGAAGGLGGAANSAFAQLPVASLATPRADVGGRLDIRVMADGQVRTERVESNNPKFEIDARSGAMFAG